MKGDRAIGKIKKKKRPRERVAGWYIGRPGSWFYFVKA
jgi:hypothetical protein